MFGHLLRSLLGFNIFPGHWPATIEYGVGFHLSFDYGVASVYLLNETWADVAKIEGSPAYKQLMRTALTSTDNGTLATSYDGAYPPYSARDLGLVQRARFSLRDHLPVWLGGIDQRYQPVKGMLKALKVATESYLDMPISAAEIALPFHVSEPYYEILSDASASIALKLPYLRMEPAGVYAARVYGLNGKGDCYYGTPDPEKLVLTVEYSRAALTALLLNEECAFYEHRRVAQDPRLGHGSIHNEAGWDDLRRAFSEITELPLKDGNGAGIKQIANVAFLGESARDPQMQGVLRRVLGERYDSVATDVGDVDPLFAAARGVAWYCRLHLQEEEFELTRKSL